MSSKEKQVVVKKKFRIGLFTIIIILGVTFFFGVKFGINALGPIVNEKEAITQSVLYQQLNRIDELATVKYLYTDMGKYESKKTIGSMNIPFTTSSFIITYDGIIKAGIDLQKIQLEVKDKTIYIKLPNSKILSHEVKEDSIVVYDEKNSIFNGLSVEDVMSFQSEQKVKMEERAIQNGIFEDAMKNAKDILRSLYEPFVKNATYEEGYRIEFMTANSETAE